MIQTSHQARRLRNGTAFALVALFTGAGMASAQTAETTTQATQQALPQAAAAAPANDDAVVVVVTGTRASQQSAIDRKRRAATATDSIAAEDIGSFPDKNINEAISRVPGIQLDRGEFGEGASVSVRGQGPEQTRVELDGVGMSSTSGGLVDGTGNARGADLRELPADLVKSLDVVKGTTASMTEGSLGGSIHINTRTGLDFKKPFVSFHYDQQMNTLGNKWTPEWSAIMARKFMGGRLGVIANVNYSEIQNNSDSEQPNTSGTAGYYRNVDLDQSPEKTFTYNPGVTAAIGDSTIPLANSTNSPLDIVTKSANAQTKADCLAAFPVLAGSGTSAAQNQRAYELQSCLNQWNDYTPSLVRLLSHDYRERRLAADIRFDYRVNDDLTVYAKVAMANRNQNNKDYTLNLGSPGFNTAAMQTQTITAGNNLTTQPRTIIPGIGNITTPYASYDNGVGGNVVTDIIGSTVDASHHATSLTLNDGNIGVDSVQYYQQIESNYAQVGGSYHHGPLKIDGLLSQSNSSFQRAQLRSAVNFTYGDVTMNVTPSGLWTYDMPSGIDFYNPDNYAQVFSQKAALKAVAASATQPAVPAYTVAQQAQWSPNFTLTWRPIMQADRESMVKFDSTYDFEGKIPFLKDVQGGLQFRTHVGSGYGGGGYTAKTGTGVVGAAGYVAPVVVPTNNNTTNYRSCLPTATSTQPCGYGFAAGTSLINNIPVPSLTNALQGTMTFTPDQLSELIGSALTTKDNFFGDYPNKAGILTSFPTLDVQKLADGIPHDTFNYDCMKFCEGSDGNIYEQPHSAYREETQALYMMFDFEQHLPYGMVFNGNAGTRYIKTTTNATGVMTITHYALAPGYDPVTNTAQGPGTSVTVNTSLSGQTEDWTPSYNLNLWVRPNVVLRYYSGHVIARPPVTQMLPAGTCTIDERYTIAENNPTGEAADPSCGRVGNPDLKPYKAINHNESVEWYINKDTMVSLGYYYNNVLIGAPIAGTASSETLFASSTTPPVDPLTGASLANVHFVYPTYTNDSGGIQRGIEFSTKMAFTYLPWFFKYTGVDYNYSKLGYKNFATAQEQISGNQLPPQNAAGYFQNLSLWYDDGRLNMRLAYQTRDSFYECISSCGSNAINDVPGIGTDPTQTVRVPYNPGFPNYRDASKYLDLRVNYKLTKELELYVSGRNIAHDTTAARTQGQYGTFSDGTPSVEYLSYGGARWEVGFTYRH